MRPSVSVLVPCYKRPEYTKLCIEALEKQRYENFHLYLVDDGNHDETFNILVGCKLENKNVRSFANTVGLRNCVIDFFKESLGKFDYIMKVDNDCVVEEDYIEKMVQAMETTKADILSPNVFPSDAAIKLGKETDIPGYRESAYVGGLWCMKGEIIKDVYFEKFSSEGITGAFQLLEQIIVEKEPKIGWATDITVQDIGHWSGKHPDHIKSEDHAMYSQEVGRRIAW